ncbi:MAG TPA: hypothetical protein VF411_01485 [Bacteroidia bacterium]
MKKVLSLFAVASLAVATVACGPSKAALEKQAKAKADSMMAVMKQDSIAAVAKMQAEQAIATAKADSTAAVAKADSLKQATEASTKGGKKGKK